MEINYQAKDIETTSLIGAQTPQFVYQCHILGMLRTMFATIAEATPVTSDELVTEHHRRIERMFMLLVASIPDPKVRDKIMVAYEKRRKLDGNVTAALNTVGMITDYVCQYAEFTESARVVGI